MRNERLKQRCAQLAAAFLCIASALCTTGCGNASAAAESPLTRSELGARQACPPGHAVEWISKTEMQCLKEI